MNNRTEPRKSTRAIERAIAVAGFTVLLIVTLIGWNNTSNKSAAENALLKADVDRLKTEWAQYDFGVFEYQLKEMDEKLDKITLLIEAL